LPIPPLIVIQRNQP